jgi:hypothetical protein
VQLIFTSPPFPLNHKKRYGNRTGDDYLEWLADLASPLKELLTEDGSIVMELGNAWVPGQPVMSTLALRALLRFLDAGQLHLCQVVVEVVGLDLPDVGPLGLKVRTDGAGRRTCASAGLGAHVPSFPAGIAPACRRTPGIWSWAATF